MFKSITRTLSIAALLSYALWTNAGVNPITLTLQPGATTTLPSGGMGEADYLVSLNPAVPGSLTLSVTGGLPTGVTPITSGTACGGISACPTTFTLSPGSNCCLRLAFTGSNMTPGPNTVAPRVATNPATYQGQASPLTVTITQNTTTTTLSTSVSTLALSVNDTSVNTALTGNPRYITIRNTGTYTATGLSVSATGLPTGTNITTIPSTCTGTLAAGSTCRITVTPGATETSSCGTGTAPTPGTITVGATNVTTAATTQVMVLTYGCQYQGGFLYSVNDTSPNTGSIGGKIASLVDQAAPNINSGPQATSIIWSSNGSGGATPNVSVDIIPGIDETSTSSIESPAYTAFSGMFDYPTNPGATYTNPVPSPALSFSACNGATDGNCNTKNMLLFYN
jgi:hypothetical protein